MVKYPFDASSLFKFLSSASLDSHDWLENLSITDPTIFEIGNILSKRKDLGIKDTALSKVIGNILREVARFPITATEIPNILEVA